jgi:hypothetical protein
MEPDFSVIILSFSMVHSPFGPEQKKIASPTDFGPELMTKIMAKQQKIGLALLV